MINLDEFRFALGKYVTGITIVTCNSENGPIGITANSFSSLSLSPPLILWSPAKASKRHANDAVRLPKDSKNKLKRHPNYLKLTN